MVAVTRHWMMCLVLKKKFRKKIIKLLYRTSLTVVKICYTSVCRGLSSFAKDRKKKKPTCVFLGSFICLSIFMLTKTNASSLVCACICLPKRCKSSACKQICQYKKKPSCFAWSPMISSSIRQRISIRVCSLINVIALQFSDGTMMTLYTRDYCYSSQSSIGVFENYYF